MCGDVRCRLIVPCSCFVRCVWFVFTHPLSLRNATTHHPPTPANLDTCADEGAGLRGVEGQALAALLQLPLRARGLPPRPHLLLPARRPHLQRSCGLRVTGRVRDRVRDRDGERRDRDSDRQGPHLLLPARRPYLQRSCGLRVTGRVRDRVRDRDGERRDRDSDRQGPHLLLPARRPHLQRSSGLRVTDRDRDRVRDRDRDS
jgi:hypothetical protein